MNRKICVVTGTRAEYGMLRWVMEEVRATAGLELQLIATGMHLSPEFGLTYREIEKDGFRIDRRVEMLLSSDSAVGTAKSMSLALASMSEAFEAMAPDLLVVLGDRFEIWAAAGAATVARLPVAHIHGGETTEGAFDEAMRHSITKMSHLHFVAAEEYRKRVIQLGEHPDRVFLVGGLGVDSIRKLPLLERRAAEQALGLQFGPKNLLITYHPETLRDSSGHQVEQLLSALDTLHDTTLIFTLPNADTGARQVRQMIEAYVAQRRSAYSFVSMGQLLYLSCIRHVDGVVGNSSSGLTEVPSLGKGTINIGDRQTGRLKAASVIDCGADRASIIAALEKLYSEQFRSELPHVRNPYGDGHASAKIVATLRDYPLGGVLRKTFYDVAFQV